MGLINTADAYGPLVNELLVVKAIVDQCTHAATATTFGYDVEYAGDWNKSNCQTREEPKV